MSDEPVNILDKLKQKPKPAEKKEVKIKYAKPEQPVKIKAEIKDKRPTSQLKRTEILDKLGIKQTTTSKISSQKIKEEEEQLELAKRLENASIPKELEPIKETTVKPEKKSTMDSKPGPSKEADLDDEITEEALLAALEEDDEGIDLKPKTTIKIKSKTQTKKSITKIGKTSDKLLSDMPEGLDKIQTRLPKKTDKILLKASSYYLNNREIFVNFINSLLEPYKKKLENSLQEYSCDKKGDGSFSLLTHQNIVRDYINLLSPYRGLLLYHGLGSGKTCSSIAIAEGIKSDKEVIVMLPKSLETNYKEELKKCGDELYRNNQYWEFINTKADPTLIDPLAYILSLSPKFIEKMGGAWFINMKEKPNYNKLSQSEQKSLNEQIEKMIENKYKFIRYNGLREKKLDQLVEAAGGNPFSNKIIVIDEAHNLISRIVNKLKRPNSLAMRLYHYLKSAENTKIVLLTGTPIINYPHEVAIMMNILRGNINTWRFQLKNEGKFKLTQDSLNELFRLNLQSNVDYLNFKSTPEPILTITRNPYGFFSNYDKDGTYKGVNLDESGNIDDATFVKVVTEILSSKGIKIVNKSVESISNNCLPDDKDEFSKLFIENSKTGGPTMLTNMDLFKRRILGLVSYFPDIDALLPKYSKMEDFKIVLVPMSEFQFAIYEEARAEERKIERNNAKKRAKKGQGSDLYEDSVSTYRIFSRAFCNFVFPRPEISRPLPRDSSKLSDIINDTANEDLLDAISIQEQLGDAGEPVTKDIAEIAEEQGLTEIATAEAVKQNFSYAESIRKALELLSQNKEKYLNPEGLEYYSPKFLNILNRLLDPEYIGTHLIYSQFRTLEGIGILALVLEANGFSQFKISKVGGEWRLNIKPEDIDKPKFILYTGTELPEEKEVLRNIFNSNWDALDGGETNTLKQELLDLGKENKNLYGEIIKAIMITASGAEGISLSNVRYVHITEPYWHPVRINQVIGRARRICSHKNLPLEKQTVEVFMYLMDFTPEQIEKASRELKQQDKSKLDRTQYMKYKTTDDPYLTSDQALFEISNQKEIITQGILTNMKEASIDCNLHNRVGTSEQLKCFTFTSVNPYKFSYAPSIEKEEKDDAKEMNQKPEDLKLKKVKLEQKEYAYNSAVLNPKNENSEGVVSTNIYSMDSVVAKNPIPIGTLFFKNSAKEGEEAKYKPTNYTFFATHK